MLAAWQPALWTAGPLGTASRALPVHPGLGQMLRLHADASRGAALPGASLADLLWAPPVASLEACCHADSERDESAALQRGGRR